MADHIPDYPSKPPAITPRMVAVQRRNRFHLAVLLASRPGFCCCCWCIGPADARRARRIIKIVKQIKRAAQKPPKQAKA